MQQTNKQERILLKDIIILTQVEGWRKIPRSSDVTFFAWLRRRKGRNKRQGH
jgi:hypothetical protein